MRNLYKENLPPHALTEIIVNTLSDCGVHIDVNKDTMALRRFILGEKLVPIAEVKANTERQTLYIPMKSSDCGGSGISTYFENEQRYVEEELNKREVNPDSVTGILVDRSDNGEYTYQIEYQGPESSASVARRSRLRDKFNTILQHKSEIYSAVEAYKQQAS